MPKRTLIGISLGLALVLVISGYYFYNSKLAGDNNSNEFLGAVTDIKGEVITLRGNFVSMPNAASRSFSFVINEKTVFKKISTRLPSLEDIKKEIEISKKSSGSFTVTPTEEVGYLADLENYLLQGDSVYVKADFPNSVDNSGIPVASLVSYHIIINPAE